MRIIFVYLIISLVLSGCLFHSDRVEIFGVDRNSIGENAEITITSVSIINDQLVINGTELSSATNVRITGPSGFDETFAIESKSFSNLIANGLQNISFTIGQVFNLIVSNAAAAATYSITFTLQDGAVTASKLDSMGAGVGHVLKYNGTTWVPSDLGGLTYAGNWNATTGLPDLDSGGNIGEYYIVDTAGPYDLLGGAGTASWGVGDWVVWNEVLNQWEKIDNATNVQSFNGRSGIVIPFANDYTWAQINKTISSINDITDVTTTGVAVDKILKWNGSAWVISDDLQGGGVGSVSSSEIANGTIVDADVSGTAAIATSKISGAVTSITSHGLGSLATKSAVDSSDITDGEIVDADVSATAAIATSKISGAVTSITSHGLGSLATKSAVVSSDITDGEIVDADVSATAAIAGTKIDPDFGSQDVVTLGSVGIGTASPAKSLDVTGSGGGTLYATGSTATAASDSNWLRSPKGTVSVFIGDSDSTASYTTDESSGDIRFNGLGVGWGDLAYYPNGGDNGEQGHFRFSKAGGDIVVTPNAKLGVGELYSAGNVGIGETNPDYELDVVGRIQVKNKSGGSLYPGVMLTAEGGTPHLTLQGASGTAGAPVASLSSSGLGAIQVRGYNGTTFPYTGNMITFLATENWSGSAAGAKIVFGTTTNGTTSVHDTMILDHNGNVGIGTATPAEKLDVVGGSTTVDRYFQIRDYDDGTISNPTRMASRDGNLMFWNGGVTVGGYSDGEIGDLGDGNMVVKGSLGIGTATPDEKLVVYNGTSTGRYTTGGWTHTSDRRLKEDIEPLESSLDKIRALEGVSYVFKTDELHTPQIGFIAQDVEEIFPEVVVTGKDGMKSIVYASLVAPAIEAIKEQQSEITSLKNKITSLKEENKVIKEILCEMFPSAKICK